jgi:hypothetical protein
MSTHFWNITNNVFCDKSSRTDVFIVALTSFTSSVINLLFVTTKSDCIYWHVIPIISYQKNRKTIRILENGN